MKNTKNLTRLIIFILFLQMFAFTFSMNSTKSTAITSETSLKKNSVFGKKALHISDLDWYYGKFQKSWHYPLVSLPGGGFEFEVNDTTLHMKEVSTESYNSHLVCYTLVNLKNEKFALSYEYKAKSINPDECDFHLLLVDPVTNISYQYPRVSYPKWVPGLEAGFNKVSFETVLEGFEQVYILFILQDNSPLNDEQEFWVQKLRYYVSGELPNTFPESYSSFSDLNWKVGMFGTSVFVLPESPAPIVDYSYSITDNQMFFEETGTGAYKQCIGAATTVNTRGRYFSISYDAKIERNLGYNGNFWLFFYDADTRELLFTTMAGINLCDYDLNADSGWIHFEHKIDFQNHDNVIMLFHHQDLYPENINHKFWVTNLKIKPLQRLHSHEPIQYEQLLRNYVLSTDRDLNL